MRITEFIDEVNRALYNGNSKRDASIVELLKFAATKGKTVFIIGNGGSAANANHLAVDLNALPVPIRAISLCSNESLLTQIANDHGYENIFSYQLERLAKPGDILIPISCSGNSPNIIKAVEFAASKVITVYGFTGGNGKLLELCMKFGGYTWIDSNDPYIIEAGHSILFHAIVHRLKDTNE